MNVIPRSDGGAHQPNALFFRKAMLSKMKAAHPDGGNALACPSECAIEHVTGSSSWRCNQWDLIHGAILLRE
jgi:hypothetical protein